MAEDRIGLAQIPNDEHGERFMVIFIDAQKVAEGHGYFMTTSRPMTEAEVRAHLEKGDVQLSKIEAMLHRARETFAATRASG
jgi:hypothetical protein